MSGQRRLATLKRLGAKKIPVLLLTQKTKYDIDGAKAASVVENLHRNKMDTKDITEASVFLTDSVGKLKAAASLGISQQTLRKYLGFAAVPDKLRQCVPGKISRDDATKLYQVIQNIPKAEKIIEKIIPLDQKLRKGYLRVLARNPRISHNKILNLAKSHMLQQKLRVELTKGNTKKLQRHANKNEISPNDMAKKILSDWLKKK